MSDDLDLIGSDPPDALRTALRDLIPDYDGPADPLPRVGVSIRRRRSRRRALFAVGSAAAAVVLVTGVPAVVGGLGPTGGLPAGSPSGGGPASAGPASPLPPPPVYRVDDGVVAGSRWQVSSTTAGGGARRCLLTQGGGFDRDLVCFGSWRAGQPASWYADVVRLDGRPVTRVTGVAPAGAASVVVRLGPTRTVEASAVRTPTDPVARFFAVLVAGDAPVRSVAARRPDGTALGVPVTVPAEPSCRQTRDNACAAPGPTG